MIVEFFIWLLGSVVHLVADLIGLIPVPDPDPILDGINDSVATVFTSAGELAFWVPFSATGSALMVVAAVAAAAGAIKLIRIVASFLTLGGGSAA